MSAPPSTDIYAETLAIFDQTEDPNEPLTTPEIAASLDANRRTVYKRLAKLVERGELKTKRVGANARVWWREALTDQPGSGQRIQLQEQRDLLRQELDNVYDRINDAIYSLDEQWRFTHLNEHAERLLGKTGEELRGEVIWERFSDTHGLLVYEKLHEAMETQEPVHFEEYYPRHDRWYEVRAYPSITGLSVHFLDVTDRRRREEELERYEAIVEAMGDPVYALDDQGRFTFVNHALAERSGYDESELVGQHVSIGMEDDDVARTAAVIADLLADDHRMSTTLEYEVITKDGGRLLAENHLSVLTDEKGRFRGTAGVLRDITDRKERERSLEESERRYKTLVENFPNGAVTLVDDELQYVTVGGTPIDEAGVTVDQLEGSPLGEILPPAFADLLVPRYIAAFGGESSTFEAEFGGRYYRFSILPVRDEGGDVFAALGMSQDITERKEYERELKTRIRQLEVIADLGQQALQDRDIDGLMERMAELVAETLENDYCEILELDIDAGGFLLREGSGLDEGTVGTTRSSAIGDDTQAGYTFAAKQPIVVKDLEIESRFTGPDLFTSHAVRSGISTVIGSYDEPWGILGTYDTGRKAFSEHDVNFVQAVANILATAINRHDHEQKLANQREHLAILDNLNQVVREITDAVIEQSSREEIEEVVCDQLASSESYTCAWIAGVNQRSGEIVSRAQAGLNGPLETSGDAMVPNNADVVVPVKEALRTREMQVTRNKVEEPLFERWRDYVGGAEVRSGASIPIVYEDTHYGVLNVYTERVGAFKRDEQAVIGQLGEVIGHTIAAVERKRALLSDEIIELEFRMQNVLEAVDLPAAFEGSIEFEQTVPIGHGVFLEYGSATGDGLAAVEALVATNAVPQWKSVNVLGTVGEVTRFELTMREPPALSAITDNGGYVDDARIADGDYYMRIHLAPSANVRAVVDAIKEAYPAMELGTQRQTTRDRHSTAQLRGLLFEVLTERQRAALEAGYYAGFFDWPRESSGEDIADTLDISSSTFHQHLRKAEKKLLDLVLAES